MTSEWIVPRICMQCGHKQDVPITTFAGVAAGAPDETVPCERCARDILVWETDMSVNPVVSA
jgi:hypothetical protein